MDEPAVIVMVDEPEPGAAMEVGLKLALAPDGRPEALRDTAALNPPEIALVMVVVPANPWLSVIDDGAADKVKLGGTVDVTVNVTLAV